MSRVKYIMKKTKNFILRKNTIVDITGVELIPGNDGKDCLGNGNHTDRRGNLIECCCDECDYLICCTENHEMVDCLDCTDCYCPHAKKEM